MATRKTSSSTRTPRRAASSTTRRSTPKASNQNILASAARTAQRRPIATAAITTGIVSGLAAAVAGFFAFKRSGKTFGEFSDDIATNLKDRAADAQTRIKDGVADARAKASDLTDRFRDGLDADPSQADIAQDALSLKQSGKTTTHPVDPTIDDELKTGAISY
jgi:hypothetical protein